MASKISEYRFSKHFNRLTQMGMWSTDTTDPFKRKLYHLYCVFWLLFLFLSIILQMMDLYYVSDNMRKVSYNLCTSVTTIGITVKVIILYHKMEEVNHLRHKLWLDCDNLKEEEDIAIMDSAYKRLNFISVLFYIACVIFLPFWLISSYFSYLWGPRSLPFPAYLPIDPDNEIQYFPTFTYQMSCGSYIIKLAMEVDLAMFSIIFQIRAQTQILNRRILKINELFKNERDMSDKVREINKYLKRDAAVKHLKSIITKQIQILGYCNTVEDTYYICMLIQVIGGSVLVIMNSLEVIMMTMEISIKLCYITGYLVLIMIDLLFICHHISDMTEETTNIGQAVYDMYWYEMDADLQRTASLIIKRAQKPPRITSGKLFVMNLNTYLGMMKNIYSWLMLFRQLEMK